MYVCMYTYIYQVLSALLCQRLPHGALAGTRIYMCVEGYIYIYIYIYICIYVYMCVCVCVCVCVCIYIYIYIYIYVYMYICVCVRVYVRVCVYIYTYIHLTINQSIYRFNPLVQLVIDVWSRHPFLSCVALLLELHGCEPDVCRQHPFPLNCIIDHSNGEGVVFGF